MTTKITITMLLTSLIIGCGGESTSEIKKSEKVIILHKVGVTGCFFLENIGKEKLQKQEDITNIHYSSKDNSVSCQTYGKIKGTLDSYNDIDANMQTECAEFTFEEIEEAFPDNDLSIYKNSKKSCVLSFDIR